MTSTQRSNLSVNEKILIDMNYNEDEHVNAILQQIIKKTKIEKTINEDEKQWKKKKIERCKRFEIYSVES